MRRQLRLFHTLLLLLLFVSGVCAAQQGPAETPEASSREQAASAALKVSLRMDDESAYMGSANVRVMPSEGYEIVGVPTQVSGETLFANMPPGMYTVEVTAPGFLAVRRTTKIQSGNRVQMFFIIMRPRPLPATALASTPVSPAALPAPNQIPPAFASTDEAAPDVEPGVECPLAEVVRGAGHRMTEFVQNLEKFDAAELVEHFNVDENGLLVKPQVHTFDYVVIVKALDPKLIELDEYRDGSVDPAQFPARIATLGLPAIALLFHPALVAGFSLSCDGLGNWQGHPAWLVHFAQRPDQPNRLREYVVAKGRYSVPLRGRVWVDAGSYQVWHLESELVKPVPDIELKQERLVIDYAPVPFHKRTEQLWLPLRAQVYWDWRGVRMYRRHSFSNFKLFEVSAGERIGNPRQSYCFANNSSQDVAGTLSVTPVSSVAAKTVEMIHFTIPAGQRICKLIGSGADVDIPVGDIASAAFAHDGAAGSITADATLSKESTLDIIPEGDSTAPKP